MATTRPRRRKPGPVGKGPRKQHTIRFPLPLDATLKAGAREAGYRDFNDFVVDLLERAVAAGIELPPVALPLTA
jgi:hypothetical protein